MADHRQTAMKRGNITKTREVAFPHSWFDLQILDQSVDRSNQPIALVRAATEFTSEFPFSQLKLCGAVRRKQAAV